MQSGGSNKVGRAAYERLIQSSQKVVLTSHAASMVRFLGQMSISNQFIRFVLVGIAALGINLVVSFLLTEYLHFWYFWSFVVGVVCSWTFLFFANAYFTFGQTEGLQFQNYAVFVGLYLGAFVINATLVLVLTSAWEIYYPISIAIAAFVTSLITFSASKKFVYTLEHGWIHQVIRNHWAALVLAFVAALLVLAPNIQLWMEPEYQGIEMMTLDAENHYFARVHQVYEGDLAIQDTFLPTKIVPYATPPLGEIIIAFFGKIFGLDAARASVVSKPFSIAAIVLLIYAFAYSLSRSKKAALIATAFPVFGYSLIAFSPQPFIDLFTNHSTAGPFIFFSRLVNTSISSLFLFGALLLMYRSLFEKLNLSWRSMCGLGVLIGASLYISPYTFSFLGALLFLIFVLYIGKREYYIARQAALAGVLALLLTVPFIVNTLALHAMPEYVHLTHFIGLVPRREFVLGLLVPLMAILAAFFWPRQYVKSGGTFLLLASAALALALNQQLLTGTYLHPGHYHWYITKPLAALMAGLFAGYFIERFVLRRFVGSAVLLILVVLFYNSFGFVTPAYTQVYAAALVDQRYGPLIEYLQTQPVAVVWASPEASDYIPVYTADGAPNSVNLGAYPVPEEYFENRIFLEYRLRGVVPKDFEETIRREINHVSGWLWGLWFRELTGDPNAVPEEEYTRLTKAYAVFYSRPFTESFQDLHVTRVVAEREDKKNYDTNPALTDPQIVGDFVVYTVTYGN
ncbi:GtrA family protein [Candidatus Parcubacteria bacterium]|nr:GtrA family protein [Candidatus Parcubacteria bacterium]